MLSRQRLIFIGLLLLECAVCILIGSFFYKKYQQHQQQDQAQYIVRLNQAAIQATAAGGLRYYYQPKPDSVSTATPQWLGYENLQTYNHDGLNERFDYPVTKTPGVVRILTLGDSFTHGDLVPTTKNWTELLEATLNTSAQKFCGSTKVEVINLGMSGFDVQYIVHRYKTLGLKYQPDIVIWLESGSGFSRQNELMQPLIEPCQQKVLSDQSAISDADKITREYECWIVAETEMKRTHTAVELRALIHKNYQEFFGLVGQTPVLIFGYVDPDQEDKQAMIEDYLKNRLNVRFLPVIPYLTPQTRLADGHPNPDGHQVIQRVILQQLQKLQPEICPAELQ